MSRRRSPIDHLDTFFACRVREQGVAQDSTREKLREALKRGCRAPQVTAVPRVTHTHKQEPRSPQAKSKD